MTGKPERGGDWSATTWKGSRLQQHREFYALPFSRKLELIEEMSDMAAQLSRGVQTSSPAILRENPPTGRHQGDCDEK